jgi:hypothetical protein
MVVAEGTTRTAMKPLSLHFLLRRTCRRLTRASLAYAAASTAAFGPGALISRILVTGAVPTVLADARVSDDGTRLCLDLARGRSVCVTRPGVAG